MLHNIRYLEGEENMHEFINSEETTILEIKENGKRKTER
jgi:hypothetical protein